MSRRNPKDKKYQKIIAKKRIDRLFCIAYENATQGKFSLANRNVEIARKISMKYLVKIPKKHKLRFCKHCYSYLLPGENCRIRVSRGKLIIFCSTCKKYYRMPLKTLKNSFRYA